MTDLDINLERLKEIIGLAKKLGWIYPNNAILVFNSPASQYPLTSVPSYPLMQLSEVEKCMIAMFNDAELERMRSWVAEYEQKAQTLKTQS